LTSFNEYFTDEVERIQKQLEDFPETFKDLWSDLADVQQDDLAEEVLAGLAQSALGNPGTDAVIQLVTASVNKALAPAQIPLLETALDELSRVKDTQDAVKVLASIVFIVKSDSVFHLMNTLAKKISRLCVLKIAAAGQLRAALNVAAAAMAAFEAAGVDSQDIRDLVIDAASDVAAAEALVASMALRSRQGTEVRQPEIDRAQASLQAAVDKLNSATVDPALIAAGAIPALLAGSDPLSVAAGGMLLASVHIQQIREHAKEMETLDRKISASILAFKVGVTNRQAASMVNYQFMILQQIQQRLSSARGSMTFAANYGSLKDIALGAPQWMIDIDVAKNLMNNLPPEVRTQEDMNADLLAAHAEAVRGLDSIVGTHIAAGVEDSADLVSALGHIVYQMENLFAQVQTGRLADNAKYLSDTSTVAGFTPLAFVSSELVEGSIRYHWISDSDTVLTSTAPPAAVPAIARIDESIIQAQLVVDAMTNYLEVQPPENVLLTTLLELLKTLRMDRGRDLLAAGNIGEFMDSGPLNWSYLGTAIDCIQKAAAAALDSGQDKIFDQLDTLLEPMTSEMNALQLRMQRESAFSISSVMDKLKAQVELLDSTKETLLGLVDKVDC